MQGEPDGPGDALQSGIRRVQLTDGANHEGLAPLLQADGDPVGDETAEELHKPHIVHDLPAGGMRFLQSTDGLSATLVSWQTIYRNGEATGALPGKVVRGKQQPEAAVA